MQTKFSFTLIELLVVIAIIAILAALLLPYGSNYYAVNIPIIITLSLNHLRKLSTIKTPSKLIVNLDSYRPEPSACTFSSNTWPFKLTAGYDYKTNTFIDAFRHGMKIQNLNADGNVVTRGWQEYDRYANKVAWVSPDR